MRKIACLLLCAPGLLAQRQTGELRLRVSDASGAALRGSVELVSHVNQVRRNESTDAQGRLVLTELPFGPYHLRVAREGFAAHAEIVEIRSEIPAERPVTLDLATIETALTITDADTLVDPTRTGVVYHIGQETLERRRGGQPARGVLELVNAQPGWLLEANGVLHPRGSEYDTQYVVDGVPVLDNRSPTFAPGFEVEDLESMKVMTANYPAEYGRKLGGVIEVVTARELREGFHGKAVIESGSFGTRTGYVAGHYRKGRTAMGLSAGGALTDRFLDPPVEENFTNHSSGGGLGVRLEQDLTGRDRLRAYFHQRRNSYLVPNELAQQQAGQRQDRASEEAMGQVSYQRAVSSRWLADVRGMLRNVSAALWSNAGSTPILAGQDRSFREAYLSGSLAAGVGRHSLKFGTETVLTRVRERFDYAIADRAFFEEDGILEFPPEFLFQGRRTGREHSAYFQDVIRAGNLTLSAGLRWDRYRMLVKGNFVSPRLGAAWHVSSAGLVLRASYDRAVTVPAIENLLLASSMEAQSLTGDSTGLPLSPSRGNFYEAGFSQALFGRVRLDGSYYRRNVRNYADDDVFLNTGVSFPISFDRAEIQGFEVKLEVPRWGRWSGSASYANMVGTGFLPVTGGLFLEEDAAELLRELGSFPITQDQRNTLRTMVRYQAHARAWLALGFSYNSGLPVEREGDLEEGVFERFGERIVNRVDFKRGRVMPSSSVDLSLGADLWTREQRSLSFQADLLNLTGRLNLINFAGLFSGTAIGVPRSFSVRLRADF